MVTIIDFLNKLEEVKIFYKLDKTNDEYIMVEVAVPGERWEIEFSVDDIQIEKFISTGHLFGEPEIDVLFANFSG